jgi:hypothetical protein
VEDWAAEAEPPDAELEPVEVWEQDEEEPAEQEREPQEVAAQASASLGPEAAGSAEPDAVREPAQRVEAREQRARLARA